MYTQDQLKKVAEVLDIYIQEVDGLFRVPTFDGEYFESTESLLVHPKGSRAIQDYLIGEGFNNFHAFKALCGEWWFSIQRTAEDKKDSLYFEGCAFKIEEALLSCMIQYVEVKDE